MFENQDASSSSEDEATSVALREACDANFLPESLFSKKDSPIAVPHENKSANNEEIKPSLRIADRGDVFENFGVSQSFKDFVAKKLDDKLARNIELHYGSNGEDEIPTEKRKKKKKRKLNSDTGIKLLSSSDDRIIDVETPELERPQRAIKSRIYSKESEATNVARCKAVAVDAEWILSKSEIKAWTERPKGNVFSYKKSCDGVLIEHPRIFV